MDGCCIRDRERQRDRETEAERGIDRDIESERVDVSGSAGSDRWVSECV